MTWHTSKIEISRSAYLNNLKFIQSQLPENVKFSSVVKGNAYGHGIQPFVNIALENNINHFSVFSSEEAFQVYQVLGQRKADIMIMGMVADEALEWVISNEIQFYIFDIERLFQAINIAKKVGKPALIHLELETGMNRTGLTNQDLSEALNAIKKNDIYVKVFGACTHFAGAESISNYVRIERQKFRYIEMCSFLQDELRDVRYFHACCSAGIMRYPEMIGDLARIGIMQYGFWPSYETFIEYSSDKLIKTDPLKRIISWKTSIMDIKNVKRGEYIGYGSIYLASKDLKIALVPVGYGYGYSRSLSNVGRVLVGGKRVAITGRVNMNLIVVDITDVPNARKGDEVVLIGKQGDLEISVASFGDASNQINYELLTRLPESLPRIIVG
ncbi:MAG: alanine racemase [Saprospirales bacterium]|nr:MAG: alanine racemase [Saprospirales bacterium]